MASLALLISKIATNLKLDFDLLFKSPMPMGARASYWVSKYVAIFRNRHEIALLGKTFGYDNRLTPALLSDYLFEIQSLSEVVDFRSVRTVLDIGANVGQFTYVLKSRFTQLKCFSFEPNSAIFPLLEANARQFSDWRVFNFGIGSADARIPFYFVAGKSAQGSLFKENAVSGLLEQNASETTILIRRLDQTFAHEAGLPLELDFVKIDVEGAEREVLNALGNVRWKYLYIEMSSARGGGLTLEAALEILRAQNPKILWQTEPAGPAKTFLVILAAQV